MNTITAGNDFRLVVCAKRSTGPVVQDMDLSDVDSIRIYLTKAGRSKVLQSYTLNEDGQAVIMVSAEDVSPGVYGIEMTGVLQNANLRAHNASAFKIVGGQGNNGVLLDYEVNILFAINVPASDVLVQQAINAHNIDPTAHPDIRELIEATKEDLEDAIEAAGGDSSAAIADLQSQINAIVADKATKSLSASPSTVFIGEMVNIALTATCSPSASAITIKKGSSTLNTGSNTGSLSASDNGITPSGNISYSADFVIAGVTKTVTKTVNAVYPIYIGAGATASDAESKQSAKTSPAGTYTITAESDGVYLWIVVPGSMTDITNKATMSGFGLELVKSSITISGVTYSAYRTKDTVDAGTHTIVIS